MSRSANLCHSNNHEILQNAKNIPSELLDFKIYVGEGEGRATVLFEFLSVGIFISLCLFEILV